jgi:hypothetical protein
MLAKSVDLVAIAPLLSVGVATTSAIIATLALRSSQKTVRYNMNTTVFLNLRDRFAKDLRESRREAAKELQERLATKAKGQLSDGLDETLFFFEELAYHTRQRHLTIEASYGFFSGMVFAYWNSYKLSGSLARRRTQDPAILEDFEWLYNRLTAYERERAGDPQLTSRYENNEAECNRFMLREQKRPIVQPSTQSNGPSPSTGTSTVAPPDHPPPAKIDPSEVEAERGVAPP